MKNILAAGILLVAAASASAAWAGDGATVIFNSGQVVKVDDGYRELAAAMKQLAGKDVTHKILELDLGGRNVILNMGTSRREFMKRNRRVLPFRVAAKTGTLRGSNPFGLNQWFIAAAPLERPTVAVAVIIVDPAHRYTRASQLGRLLLQKHLGVNGV